MPISARFLKTVRLTHLYLGVFVAPAILFFAFTGALQTFSFHETTPGSSYQPPHLFVVLAQIHKKQTPILPPPRKPQPIPQGSASAPDHHDHPDSAAAVPVPSRAPAPEPKPKHSPYPLKIFFLVVAISLCLSTFSGIYMAWAYSRNKVAIATLLVLGALIPLLMMLV